MCQHGTWLISASWRIHIHTWLSERGCVWFDGDWRRRRRLRDDVDWGGRRAEHDVVSCCERMKGSLANRCRPTLLVKDNWLLFALAAGGCHKFPSTRKYRKDLIFAKLTLILSKWICTYIAKNTFLLISYCLAPRRHVKKGKFLTSKLTSSL